MIYAGAPTKDVPPFPSGHGTPLTLGTEPPLPAGKQFSTSHGRGEHCPVYADDHQVFVMSITVHVAPRWGDGVARLTWWGLARILRPVAVVIR